MRLLIIVIFSLSIIIMSAKSRFIDFPYSLVEGDKNPIGILLQSKSRSAESFFQSKSLLPIKSQSQSDPTDTDNIQLRVFNEILESRNDNDPRLDTMFKQISPKTKLALRSRYHELKTEDRNGRGLIVFVLGQNITSNADFEFFRKVLSESPCLSLGDCNQPAKTSVEDDSAQTVTLVYPQMIALESLKRYLTTNSGSNDVVQILRLAQQSKSSLITETATQILLRFQSKSDQLSSNWL